jgi:hypothetical protein
MSPLGMALTVVFAAVVLFARCRIAALGVFAAVCYITQSQQVAIAGFNFTAIRIILATGLVRLLVRGELRKRKLNSIDWAVLAYALINVLLPALRTSRSEMFIYQTGIAYDTLLSYFVLRGLVNSWEDTRNLIYNLAFLIMPLVLFMVLESLTGRSVFSVMGDHVSPSLREGRYRCVGSFRGPHTAGTFAAALVPLFVGLFMVNRQRWAAAAAGIVAATVMTYTSNSSGPLMAYVSGLVALVFWQKRKDMRTVRRGLAAILIALAIVMKAPIWYLIAKISSLTGGDGWHRAFLMDQCYQHFFDWWLMGTDDTSKWAVTMMSWGGADITNQYVSCAANAGLASLILFIIILVRCFRNLGLALIVARQTNSGAEPLFWCLGCALFAHVVTIFSVTYWDQMYVAWWGLLAIISSVTAVPKTARNREGLPVVATGGPCLQPAGSHNSQQLPATPSEQERGFAARKAEDCSALALI